jgi:hypothetical protein
MSKAHCSVRPFSGVKLIASVVEATLHLAFGGSAGIRPIVLAAVVGNVRLRPHRPVVWAVVVENVRLRPHRPVVWAVVVENVRFQPFQPVVWAAVVKDVRAQPGRDPYAPETSSISRCRPIWAYNSGERLFRVTAARIPPIAATRIKAGRIQRNGLSGLPISRPNCEAA